MSSPHPHVSPQNDLAERRAHRRLVEQLADLFEANMLESTEQAAQKISNSLGIAPIGTEIREILQQPIREAAEGMAAVVAAGESPVGFADHLAAQYRRIIEES